MMHYEIWYTDTTGFWYYRRRKHFINMMHDVRFLRRMPHIISITIYPIIEGFEIVEGRK